MAAPTDAKDPEERRAEEAAMRARLQTAPGVASPARVAGRSGLQILRALLAGEIPPPPMAVTLDFNLLRIELGFAIFRAMRRWPRRRLASRPEACGGAAQSPFVRLFNFGLATKAFCPERPLSGTFQKGPLLAVSGPSGLVA